MLKKIISFVILSVFALSITTAFAQQETATPRYIEKRYELSKELLSQIAETELTSENPESYITRAQLVSEICKVMGISQNNDSEQIYNDVPKTNENSGYIAAACENGIISRAEKFNPNREATYPEALKMILCAFGCESAADVCGGYFSGYKTVADKLGVTKGTGYSLYAKITAADVCIMLRNILLASTVEIEKISGDYPNGSVTYETEEKLNIEKYFGLSKSEGVITETAYSSLTLGTDINKGKFIGVDGERCKGYYVGEEYLGLNAEIYYDRNDEVRAIVPTGNDQTEFDLEDYDRIEDGNIYYTNKLDRIVSVRLDETYTIIYNGRRIEALTAEMLKRETGSVRLVDNDNDGNADIVFFSEYTYGFIESIDYTDGYIGIKDSAPIRTDRETVGLICTDIGGEAVNPYDLECGEPVAVRQSPDGLLVRIIVCGEVAEGILNSVGTDSLQIDDKEYHASENFLTEEKERLRLNSVLRIALGINGEAALICDAIHEYDYGYVIKWVPENKRLSNQIKMKILTENNSVEVFALADKVRIDKARTRVNLTDAAAALASLDRGLIRYTLDKDGRIDSIDLPKAAQASEAQADSELLVCNYSAVNGYYRSASKAFVPYATVSSAVMFNVPTNADAEDEEYSVIKLSDIMGNTRHTADLYDIDSYGYAGAAVLYDSDAAKINYTSQSYIVQKVVSMNDSDGESGTGLKCWSNNGIETLFVPDDVSLKKSDGGAVGFGDIIRIKMKNNKIEDVIIDIDMSSGMPKLNAGSTAELNVTPANISYNTGYVYSCSDNSICLSETRENGRKLNPADMRYFFISANVKAVRLKTGEKTLEPIGTEGIRSTLGFGSGGDYAVIRQVNDSTSTIFIIE